MEKIRLFYILQVSKYYDNMRSCFIGILLLFSASAFGQKLACENFRDGKFEIVDPAIGKSTIERKGSYQLEYGEASELKLEFKVEWLNECTYTLELENVLENPAGIDLPEGMILRVEIIETKENSYIQKTSSNFYDMVLESEMFRIE